VRPSLHLVRKGCRNLGVGPWLSCGLNKNEIDYAERDRAKEAVRLVLKKLPLGADAKTMERAQEFALAPFKAAVANRNEKARLETQRQFSRQSAGWKADAQLSHVRKYLRETFEFPGGDLELLREVNRVQPLIREALIEELAENPNMTPDEIRESIEDQIDAELDD
jgi:hypothetical protein